MRVQWICGVAAVAIMGAAGSRLLAQVVQIIPVTPVTPKSTPAAPTTAPSAPAAQPPAAPVAAAPARPAAAPVLGARKLQVSFSNGLVTIVAANVTVREILAEWTRVGGTKFVDAEKLTGGAVTMEFHNRPEQDVLNSLLRSAAGLIIDPARVATTGSIYPVVSILATSKVTASGFVPPAPPTPVPGMNGMPDDELPPVISPGDRAGGPAPGQPVTVAPVTPAPGGGRGGGPGGGR